MSLVNSSYPSFLHKAYHRLDPTKGVLAMTGPVTHDLLSGFSFGIFMCEVSETLSKVRIELYNDTACASDHLLFQCAHVVHLIKMPSNTLPARSYPHWLKNGPPWQLSSAVVFLVADNTLTSMCLFHHESLLPLGKNYQLFLLGKISKPPTCS